MTPYVIEDTDGNVLDVVKADNAIDALSAYSVAQGFGPYAAPDSVDDNDVVKAYVLEDGTVGGVFTNYEIVAKPIGDEYVDVDYLKGLDDLALAAIIGRGDMAPVVEVADAIGVMRGARAQERAYEVASADVVLPLTAWQAQRIHDLLTTLADVENDLYDVHELRVVDEVTALCALIRAHGGATGDAAPVVDEAIAADAAALKAYSVSPTRCAQMGDALAVIVLDRRNRESIDPKALEQARNALGLS